MAQKRVRKAWSDAEKLLICDHARTPGVSVSRVARRYDVNANLVFTWLRDERYRSTESKPSVCDAAPIEDAGFLPVEIIEHEHTEAREACLSSAKPSVGTSVLEVDLACGHQLRVMGSYDPAALSQLIRGLSA